MAATIEIMLVAMLALTAAVPVLAALGALLLRVAKPPLTLRSVDADPCSATSCTDCRAPETLAVADVLAEIATTDTTTRLPVAAAPVPPEAVADGA